MTLAVNDVLSPKELGSSDLHKVAPQPKWSWRDMLLPLLLTLPVCMTIALEPSHSDSSIFMYIGQSWAHGTVPYVQIFDNKPPGLYALIALISHFSLSLWAIALTQFVFVVGMIFGVSAILKRTGAPRRAVFFGTLCAALAVNIPYYSPYNMAESYMICPMVFSMLVFLRALDSQKLRDFFLAGLCSGLACVFKPFGLSVLLAQAVFLLMRAVPRRCIRSALVLVVASFLGVAVAWVPFALYFWRNGALKEMLDAWFLYNMRCGPFNYYSLSSLSSAIRIPSMLADRLMPVSTMVACLIFGSYYGYKTRTDLYANRRQMWALLSLWFAFGLMLVLAAGRGHGHYFLTVMPALALASGLFLWSCEERFHGSGLRLVIAALVLSPALLAYFPSLEPAARMVLPHNEIVAPDERVSMELRKVALPGSTMMEFGYDPWIFYSTRMRCVSRYYSTRYVYEFPYNYVQIGHEILKDMHKTPPDFIVVALEQRDYGWIPPDGDPFKDQFTEIVNHSYEKFAQVQGYLLYRRK